MCNRTRAVAVRASQARRNGVGLKADRSVAAHKGVRSVAVQARSNLPADSLVADFRAAGSQAPADLVRAVRVVHPEVVVPLSKYRAAVAAAAVASRGNIAS